ncbi:hypothetical protein BD309DRAFT_951089 [Dichomitus squalens]|nr:hypothetical protein BD309DRAFT_951089 [Dichomitus squalens]
MYKTPCMQQRLKQHPRHFANSARSHPRGPSTFTLSPSRRHPTSPSVALYPSHF